LNGLFGKGDPATLADAQIQRLVAEMQETTLLEPTTGRVIAVKPARIGRGGLTLTFRDISEQVRSERDLNQANAMLEKRVAERTVELERLNAALETANSAAEEANIGKTRFIAAAGHDILQPLNAARLYATALTDQLDDKSQRALAGNLGSALDSVEDIFRAVLDLSRLDTGRLKPDIQPFPVQDLLNQLKVEFEPLAQSKGLDLRFIDSSLSVRSDAHLLRRLAQNLVSNAIKYTGSGRIVVGCRRRKNAVSLEIVDTGIGIAEADREAAFVEFQRLEAGVKAAPGLGLGLSIVQRIATALDCRLQIHSTTAAGEQPDSRSDAGRLSSGRWQRADGHCRSALEIRCRNSGDTDHGGPLRGSPCGSGPGQCSGFEQTDQTGGTARPDGAMLQPAIPGCAQPSRQQNSGTGRGG